MSFEMVAFIWFLVALTIVVFLCGSSQKELEDSQYGVQNGLPGNPMTDYEQTKSKVKRAKKPKKKKK